MKKRIIAAILAENKEEFIKQLDHIKTEIKNIQVDIMDGKFVKQKSLQISSIPVLKDYNAEAHLMVFNPDKYMKEVKKKGFKKIVFHCEASGDIKKTIGIIKKCRLIPAIAINPETPLSKIKPFLKDVCCVQFMSVEPGKMGQKFMNSTLKKIKAIRKLYPKLDIQVDGGICPETEQKAINAGANIFVSGHFLTESKDVKQAVKDLEANM